MEPKIIHIGVAAIVLNSQGDILIGFDGHKNKWAFPGGNWEGETNGETYAEAAIREIFEETGGNYGKGIKCRISKQIYETVFYREDLQFWYKSIGFLAEYISGELADDPDEQRINWKFLPASEISKLNLFQPAKEGLAKYINSISR
jgi:ADP-ribose pyrophosphatase YjhB (NUDIX family)